MKYTDLKPLQNTNKMLTTKSNIWKSLLMYAPDTAGFLAKKRPMLLTFALVFCIFYGISLMICLPPYIIRGKKRDINEERIKQIQVEISVLRSQRQII